MPLTTSKVKTPLGMQTLDFWPIESEPDGGHPTYAASVNLGAAVKGYLSVSTASASIPGVDIVQVEDEVFTGAQLDTETTMSDLQVNAILFGHAYTEKDGEERNHRKKNCRDVQVHAEQRQKDGHSELLETDHAAVERNAEESDHKEARVAEHLPYI